MAKATRKDLLFIKEKYDTCIRNLMYDLQERRDALITTTRDFDFPKKRDEEYFRKLVVEAVIYHTRQLIEEYEFKFTVINKAREIINGDEEE